jgi:twitching motility two-component system response regulator PilG
MSCVLIIDDSPTVRKILEYGLKRVGFAAVAFSDGPTAIAALAQGVVPVPDLLVLDIGLPQMDGYEVARRIKHMPGLRHIAIILLSGRDGVVAHLRGRLAGASAYMTKPVNVPDLVAVVRAALADAGRPAGPGDTRAEAYRYA